ncbi:MAG: diphosphate--fructose-6-phosphate 1-phosphotransferase [Candidatus Nealsonbacteria bacterium]|nr:diphosphate--fructose-6-phosphate 1-phosphotransferase [Candidatus Nealsonbacteria bacterium]
MGKKVNAVVLQSGGPTAVINKSLYGVYSAWQAINAEIYGSLFGVNGILENRVINLNTLNKALIQSASECPSAALGSARFNLQDENGFKKEVLAKIFMVFDQLDIGYCFLIGGDDSRENANTLFEYAKQIGYDLIVIHIPKTIDNDLTFTHHGPGFASAAKFIAMAVMGIDLDNRAFPGVMIDVVMGRNAGWLAASSMLAKRNEKMGPHFIYLPESDFSIENFLSDVSDSVSTCGRAHVVVAEGVSEKPCIVEYVSQIGGTEFLSRLCGVDDFKHAQLSGNGFFGTILRHLLETNLKKSIRVRANTFDYLQRSFPLFSKADQHQAYMVGKKAVHFALDERSNIMVTVGTEEFRYNDAIDFVSLEQVFKDGRGQIKTVPKDIIVKGNKISDDFKTYMGPLVDGLPEVNLLF